MNTVTKHGWRTEIHDYEPNGGFVRWENHRTFYGGFSSHGADDTGGFLLLMVIPESRNWPV